MENIVSGTTGTIHLVVSILALLSGTFTLVQKKGTKQHKQIGYTYVVSMILLNSTAFMIYKLFGKFGIFHWFAILSCLTLFAGMYPVITKRTQNYLLTHFNFMYWSVTGLYCALCAEILTRVPFLLNIPNSQRLFGILTGISIFLVMGISTVIFAKNKQTWTKQYKKIAD